MCCDDVRLNKFNRGKNGSPSYVFSFEAIDIHEAEKKGYYREAVAELDSYIDDWLRKISRSAYQMSYKETVKMVKEGRYGERLAEELHSIKYIPNSVYKEIQYFKTKRNIVIHSPSGYLGLVEPEVEKFTTKRMWEKLARQRFEEIKLRGFNILYELQEIRMKMRPSP